jgi:hypothetical protein
MFDVPADTWYLWLGLSLVATAAVGVATQFPQATAPDAARAATTIDSVAASDHEAVASHPLDAREVRLGASRIGLRGPVGASHATLAYGPVVPTVGDERLAAVLDGAPPATQFPGRQQFVAAVESAQTRDPEWWQAPDSLTIRRVTWGEEHVTLVGS